MLRRKSSSVSLLFLLSKSCHHPQMKPGSPLTPTYLPPLVPLVEEGTIMSEPRAHRCKLDTFAEQPLPPDLHREWASRNLASRDIWVLSAWWKGHYGEAPSMSNFCKKEAVLTCTRGSEWSQSSAMHNQHNCTRQPCHSTYTAYCISSFCLFPPCPPLSTPPRFPVLC